MRAGVLRWMLIVVAVCSCPNMARSELLGIKPGLPTIFYNSAGVTEYHADTEVFSIDALPLSIRFNPGVPQPIGKPASLTVRILVDGDGNLIGGVDGADLVVIGTVGEYSGELLTGEILEFGFENTSPKKGGTDQYDLRFAITGGAFSSLYLGRNIGITVTSEHSSFSGAFIEDFDGGAKGNIGPLPCSGNDQCDDNDPCTTDACVSGECEHTDDPTCDCELEVVVEGCIIVSPTPPAGYVCDKPIEVLTMIWDGAEPVRVKAYKGSVGSDLLADIDNIEVGDEISISGYTGSPNDVFWEVFQAATDNLIGLSKFHVSCSDQEMNGPEDCGNREGDGKNNEPDLINDWLLEGIVDEGGELDCTP